jgi:hypothetical protein
LSPSLLRHPSPTPFDDSTDNSSIDVDQLQWESVRKVLWYLSNGFPILTIKKRFCIPKKCTIISKLTEGFPLHDYHLMRAGYAWLCLASAVLKHCLVAGVSVDEDEERVTALPQETTCRRLVKQLWSQDSPDIVHCDDCSEGSMYSQYEIMFDNLKERAGIENDDNEDNGIYTVTDYYSDGEQQTLFTSNSDEYLDNGTFIDPYLWVIPEYSTYQRWESPTPLFKALNESFDITGFSTRKLKQTDSPATHNPLSEFTLLVPDKSITFLRKANVLDVDHKKAHDAQDHFKRKIPTCDSYTVQQGTLADFAHHIFMMKEQKTNRENEYLDDIKYIYEAIFSNPRCMNLHLHFIMKHGPDPDYY